MKAEVTKSQSGVEKQKLFGLIEDGLHLETVCP
jgi:hypothetical protein